MSANGLSGCSTVLLPTRVGADLMLWDKTADLNNWDSEYTQNRSLDKDDIEYT